MTGTVVDLDGCIDLRPPPRSENRMHTTLLFCCFALLAHLDKSKRKKVFSECLLLRTSASGVSVQMNRSRVL